MLSDFMPLGIGEPHKNGRRRMQVAERDVIPNSQLVGLSHPAEHVGDLGCGVDVTDGYKPIRDQDEIFKTGRRFAATIPNVRVDGHWRGTHKHRFVALKDW